MSNVIHCILPLLLLILFAVAHIIYIYSFCLVAIENLYHRLVFLIFINLIGSMFLWSIFATICSSVGDVPEEYKFKHTEHNELVRARTEDERDAILEKFCHTNNLLLRTCTPTGSIRYCVTCKHIKPDRAHHCSTCKRCYLKMDHHCPWVNNCVGFRNYKSFLLSLSYGFLYCLFYTLSTIHYIVFYVSAVRYMADLALTIGFGLALIMAITTMGFLTYHIYLLFKNETTLENTHPPTFAEDDMTFDLGAAQNFLAVFGRPCYLWFLPIFTSSESGDIFMVERIDRS